MRKILEAGAFALAFLLTGCAPRHVPLEEGDTLTVYVDNYSIQDFEAYLECSLVLSPSSSDHQKLVNLLSDMMDDTFENEDGSDYYSISITDATGVEKVYLTIPQGGGRHPKSKELFKLLDKICGR